MTYTQPRQHRRALSIDFNLLSPNPPTRSLRRRLLSLPSISLSSQASFTTSSTFFQPGSNPSQPPVSNYDPLFIPPPTELSGPTPPPVPAPALPTPPPPSPPPPTPPPPSPPSPPPPPPPPPSPPRTQPLPAISTLIIPHESQQVPQPAPAPVRAPAQVPQPAPVPVHAPAQVPPPARDAHQPHQPAAKPSPPPLPLSLPAAQHHPLPKPPPAAHVNHVPVISTIIKPNDNYNPLPPVAPPPSAAHIPQHHYNPPPTSAAHTPQHHYNPPPTSAADAKHSPTPKPVVLPNQPEKARPPVKKPVASTPPPRPQVHPPPVLPPNHGPKPSSPTPPHPAVKPTPPTPHPPSHNPPRPSSFVKPLPSPSSHPPAQLHPPPTFGSQIPPAPQSKGSHDPNSSSPPPLQASKVVVPQTNLVPPIGFGNNQTLASNNLTSPIASSSNFTSSPTRSNTSEIDSGINFFNGSAVPPTNDQPNRLAKAMGGMFGSLVGLSAVLVAAILVAKRARGRKPNPALASVKGAPPASIRSTRNTIDNLVGSPNLMVQRENGPTIQSSMAPADPVTRYSQGGVTLLSRLQGFTANLGQVASPNAQPGSSSTLDPEMIQSYQSDFSLADSHGLVSMRRDEHPDTGISLVDPVLGTDPQAPGASALQVASSSDSSPSGSSGNEEARRLLRRSQSDDGSIRNPFEHELSSSSDLNDGRISLSTDLAHMPAPGDLISHVSEEGDQQGPATFGNQIIDQQERLATPNLDTPNHTHEVLTRSIMQSLTSSPPRSPINRQ